MKTLSPFFTLVLIGILAFGQACEKDVDPREETNNKLNGDWDVTSLTIDGSETIPAAISSFEMEFDKENAFDGSAEWTLIAARTGQTSKVKGDYDIQDSGTELNFDGDDLEIDFRNDDRLELEGVINNQRWVIKADRD